jgi:hypothetical protein
MSSISQWLRLPADLFFRREDERIYAAVRIGFAALVLLNLIFLWPDRSVFFSDAGLLDQSIAIHQASPVYLSIFAFARSETAVTGVMLVTAAASVMLMAGVGARLAALWILVWHISYIARAPLALGGWDLIPRAFSFLILVSPMGKCWTLPALLRGHRGLVPEDVPRYGLILMRLQVVVIYWQTVLARLASPDPYWKNGEFLSYFMLSHHARWPGQWVLEYGSVMVLGTYAIQMTESAIPLLLWKKKTRWWGALLGALLHAGIALFSLDLGLFCLSMLMTYLAFLRKEDVEGLERWMKYGWKRSSDCSS